MLKMLLYFFRKISLCIWFLKISFFFTKQKIFFNLGADVITNSPAEFTHLMSEESLKMAKAVKISGAQID